MVRYVPSEFRSVIISPWTCFVDCDPWICLTIASLGFFRIADCARASTSSYSSLRATKAFWTYVFFPLKSSCPLVESANLPSLATRPNSFQYFVTDSFPCFMLFSLILAAPLTSITPNWVSNSALNRAQVSHAGVISSSASGVIQVPPSSIRRLVEYRILSSSLPF